jgi:hypothetical protein
VRASPCYQCANVVWLDLEGSSSERYSWVVDMM